LPVSRGLYNFDHFSIEYFGDTDVARQVLRGGAYDYNREFSATGYSIGFDSRRLSDGRLQKAHLATEAPQSAQGFVFNLQKPMFQDRRVRPGAGHALGFRVEQPPEQHEIPPNRATFPTPILPPGTCRTLQS
jgi:ABC-type oligopeptide transport system substrate-binding subunit